MRPTQTKPEVIRFKRIQANWEFLDQSAFESAVDDDLVAPIISSRKKEIIWKILKKRKELCDYYREFVELCIHLLGSIPSCKVAFLAPGPIHLARWMAKFILDVPRIA